MAWLTGWAKGIKITVDHNDIDSALTNFPTLVKLSTSSGYNNVDVSCIFDELESNANRKKIAITTSDGETQCFVEIEKWDHANEKAWLWIKVPSVASGADTELYIYYDKTKADNTDYVGDTNSTPAENVWDSNFKFVCHMRDDPDTSHIRDSTNNNNDGTKKGANEPAVTTSGKIDDAQDFDGIDDYIDCEQDASLDFTPDVDEFTLEAWIKIDSEDIGTIVSKSKNVQRQYQLYVSSDNLYAYSGHVIVDSGVTVADSNPHYVGMKNYDDVGTLKFRTFIDGTIDDTIGISGSTMAPGMDVLIGARRHLDNTDIGFLFDGIIDEVRISNIARTPAWIKASYESGRDHLLDFGSEEELALGQPIHLRRRGRIISLGGVR